VNLGPKKQQGQKETARNILLHFPGAGVLRRFMP
jgi:hypothetical protein